MQTWSKPFMPSRGRCRRHHGGLSGPESIRIAVCFAEPAGFEVLPIHAEAAQIQRPTCQAAANRERFFTVHFRLPWTYRRGVRWIPLLWVWSALVVQVASAQPANALGVADTNSPSRFIEVAGQVEFAPGGTNWQTAVTGLALHPGDRVRTRERSRAAVQLSDRRVIRLGARTPLEILPPRRNEKKRLGLPRGSLFFSTVRNPPIWSSTRRSRPEQFAARNSCWQSPMRMAPCIWR